MFLKNTPGFSRVLGVWSRCAGGGVTALHNTPYTVYETWNLRVHSLWADVAVAVQCRSWWSFKPAAPCGGWRPRDWLRPPVRGRSLDHLRWSTLHWEVRETMDSFF